MLHVLGCLSDRHEWGLVAIAALLCGFSCRTTVVLLSRVRLGPDGPRLAWIASASLVFGGGAWATHFVAMLAYRSGMPIVYVYDGTALSIAAAILFSAAGFATMFRPGLTSMGGAIVGFGISAMHYIGMEAVRGDFRLDWQFQYVLASIVVAIVFAVAAAQAFRNVRGLAGLSATAVLFAMGICAMHFTGMSAVTLIPSPAVHFQGPALAPGGLATAVTAIGILILTLGQVSAQLDRHLAMRRCKEALRQRTYIAELESTRTRLNAALYDADKANEAKSAFLTTMSHELRTPLNAIIGFTELMQAAVFGPIGHEKYADYIADIHNSGHHLLSLINDILDLSRLDAGKVELKEDVFSLRELADDVRRSLEPLAAKASQSLVMEVAADLPWLRADQRRFRQILLNLLSNAVKFTPAGGSITMTAAEMDGALVMEVRDTGIGMSEAEILKALERFGQVDSSMARKYEGTGLGLPLAKQLVELHGGRFDIASKPGKGTTITMKFPADRLTEAPAARGAKIVALRPRIQQGVAA